ncbi:hypothetical protein Hanom_Chr11g00999001 [Helianthus anomalus]
MNPNNLISNKILFELIENIQTCYHIAKLNLVHLHFSEPKIQWTNLSISQDRGKVCRHPTLSRLSEQFCTSYSSTQQGLYISKLTSNTQRCTYLANIPINQNIAAIKISMNNTRVMRVQVI